jgi:splicing factor 3B subunit 3
LSQGSTKGRKKFILITLQNVIDGDLCEQFNSIDLSKQKQIAEELDRLPSEVSKKLEDIRTRYAF